jgi:hypothetical protein
MGDDRQIVKYTQTFSFCLTDNTVCLHYKEKPAKLFGHSITTYCENYVKHNVINVGKLHSLSSVTAVVHLLCV